MPNTCIKGITCFKFVLNQPNKMQDFTNQIDKNIFEINLRGIIGLDISGAAVAEQIDGLTAAGAKKIILRINTPGGSVIEGYSIIEAMQRSTAEIETINAGIAGSMGAIILAVGDKRKALDYSTALIHDPSTNGQSLEQIEDEQKRANIQRIKDSIAGILQTYTGKALTTINKIMTRETVFSANEQKEFGLVDRVIKSRVKKPNFSNLSLAQIMNVCQELETKNQPNKIKMKNLTDYLNLSNEASEEAILQAVKERGQTADTYKNQMETAQNDLAQAKADLEEAQKQLAGLQNQAIENAVNAAIATGKFTAEQKELLTDQAKANLDVFNKMVEAIPAPAGGVMREIKNQKNEGEELKDWEYYQNHEPEKLKVMETENPAEYKKLYEAYWEEPYM